MLTFTTLLREAGLDPASVRLLRHQDSRYPGCPTPYVLWRDYRERFEAYQSTHAFTKEARLRAPYWASFVGLAERETMFVGLYTPGFVGPLPEDVPHPMTGDPIPAGSCNLYRPELLTTLEDYAGRLWIDWGRNFRTWIQRGDGEPKPIRELRRKFSEDAFPGFVNVLLDFSLIDTLPASWLAALGATRGIYLLTCPRTREQYVGMASGAGGFLARWREYAASGHGGNVALKSRDPSDYQVSILETVGTTATEAELLALESLWKNKLQSRDMGLNRN